MVDHHIEFRRCLSECDVVSIRKLWKHVCPHLHQPSTDHETLATIHCARTQSIWLDIRDRAYSHHWLLDHGLPSALPDNLKDKAERMYPKVVEGVGIAVRVSSEFLQVVAPVLLTAMSNAVMDAYAEGHTDPPFVKDRIQEARKKVITQLLGKNGN